MISGKVHNLSPDARLQNRFNACIRTSEGRTAVLRHFASVGSFGKPDSTERMQTLAAGLELILRAEWSAASQVSYHACMLHACCLAYAQTLDRILT
jgi:hypothetical protein